MRGIIPAYAGSTRPAGRSPPGPSDHPRIRGEHDFSDEKPIPVAGSSPHTRGAHTHASLLLRAGGIIPAYAGSTFLTDVVNHGTRDHPRIRGEHCTLVHDAFKNTGSSPHTRGAPHDDRHPHAALRIIPAYAGSTCRRVSDQKVGGDHPRIRGEHGDMNPPPGVPVGSSPHTRGARHVLGRARVRLRIIPAYAGSTPARRRD